MLSPEIQTALAILTRGSASIGAVMGTDTSENRFTKALEDLQRLAEQCSIPIAIVGGLGAIRYGYPAATEDIDVAIGDEDLDRLVRVAPEFSFNVACKAESGWHTLTHGDVEINIVPEGRKAKNNSPTTIPGPVQLGVASGLGYANLASWMELKISSGRQKNYAHVVEVLKKCNADQVTLAKTHLSAVHANYLATLNRLIEEANDETEQERARGNR